MSPRDRPINLIHDNYVGNQGNRVEEQQDDDDKFERRGEYYQCVKCEQYTVHFKNDKYCENVTCASNAAMKYANK